MMLRENNVNRTAIDLINRIDPSLSLKAVFKNEGSSKWAYKVSRRGEAYVLKVGPNEPIILEKLQGIEHVPNLIAVYQHGSMPVVLKEYIPGELRKYLNPNPQEIRRDIDQGRRLVDKIHTRDVYFLDPHPLNIIINSNGVYLFDFDKTYSEDEAEKSRHHKSKDDYKEYDHKRIRISLRKGL